MTTFTVPLPGSLAWRKLHPVPPNAPLYMVGPYCPLDDTQLQERADGFGCPVCEAAWDFHGLSGRWLPATAAVATGETPARWRTWAPALAAGVAACALGAAAVVLDERLVCWLAAMIGAAAVAVVLGALVGRYRDWLRYRHNRVMRVIAREVIR
ncbi:hypothetical protein EV385_6612 [Krasilnikovia cinnamomea]|uniref:Uncharacterized protein n=1 Tax=Krasilnikovia cinnamomea TaxID=349313 RepID=A0A4Q7Z7X4_9ACTN|nr:hypothetical protein [Krasilnikovia cinnamomea]RZU46538.1 hypothetical protein EV385_6612 [Krasilnikovia cinnamomea]